MSDAGRHVAMLVRNSYTHDSRVEKEVRTLIGAGYRVTVVADAGPGLPVREERDGAVVIRVGRVGPPIPGLRFVVHEWRLTALLRDLGPDILHAHDSNALLPVAVAAAHLGRPYLYDAHDLWLGRLRRGRSLPYFWLSQLYYALLQRIAVPRAAAVITVSGPIVAHLRQRYRPGWIGLVANYPEPPGEPSPRDLRGHAGVVGHDPVAVYLGGLMSGRGLEQLIDAVARLPGVHLVLLGDGGLADDLRLRARERGVTERVHFAVPVPPDQVVDFAAGAQVGVSPVLGTSLNYRYSLPNKLFQYMAAGIPVVASDLPQVREVVEGSGCGMVADTSRPEAIADAIASVLADPVEARAMGERGRRAVVERYNWDASASVLLEAYRRMGRTIAAATRTRNSHARKARSDPE